MSVCEVGQLKESREDQHCSEPSPSPKLAVLCPAHGTLSLQLPSLTRGSSSRWSMRLNSLMK